MEVFLVPIGPGRYELYCEVADEPENTAEENEPQPRTWRHRLNPRVWFQNLKHRFMLILAEAERQRRLDHPVEHHEGWLTRVKARLMRWVAESVAEQRLLWALRRHEAATFFYPDDMPEADAIRVLRTQLAKDFDKHRFWLIIDSLGLIASGALMLFPGPNVLAYYFAFRLVGHFFSLRGAKQGLCGTTWTYAGSVPLSELRTMLQMEPDLREQRVQDVAGALRLEHLARFFQRTAIPSA